MPGQPSWNEYFGELLKNSPTRPTSITIAKAINSRFPLEQPVVTPALVEKWRVKHAARAYQPRTLAIARALADALDGLGVFQFQDVAVVEDKIAEFLRLIDPAFTGGRSVEQIVRTACNAARGELLSIYTQRPEDSTRRLDAAQLLLATACLLSQRTYGDDLGALQKETEGRVILFLFWDIGSSPQSQKRTNAMAEELREPAFGNSWRSLAPKIRTYVVLGTWCRNENDAGKRDAENDKRELEQKILNSENGSPVPEDKKTKVGIVPISSERTLPEALYLAINLHSNGTKRGWRMIRHPKLFMKLESSRAATFCTPLDDEELDSEFERFGITGIRWDGLIGKWRTPWDEAATSLGENNHERRAHVRTGRKTRKKKEKK
ncbi:MAG: hypothetical protein HZA93_18640 [Verrucomicrobia bacterium]|nr:hypothetical protein [Verrucomicrobiota bacterium]